LLNLWKYNITVNSEFGVHVGGQAVNMIRYADDKTVACNTQKGLQELMNNLNSDKRICREDQRQKDKSDVYFKQRKDQNEYPYRWSAN